MSVDLVPQGRDTRFSGRLGGLSLHVEPTEPPVDAETQPSQVDATLRVVIDWPAWLPWLPGGPPGLALARLAVHERGPIPSLNALSAAENRRQSVVPLDSISRHAAKAHRQSSQILSPGPALAARGTSRGGARTMRNRECSSWMALPPEIS
jgi:hypothetical protein